MNQSQQHYGSLAPPPGGRADDPSFIHTDNIQLLPKRSDFGSEVGDIPPSLGGGGGPPVSGMGKLSKPPLPAAQNRSQVVKRLDLTSQKQQQDDQRKAANFLDRTLVINEVPTPSSHNFNSAQHGESYFNQSQHYGSFLGSKNTFKTNHDLVYADKKALKQDVTWTPYMKEYQKNVEFEWLKQYDQQSIDERYQARQHYEKKHSQIPKILEQQFDARHSTIKFSEEQIGQLRESFEKFDEHNTGVMDAKQLKEQFLKYGYDKSNPPLYSMLSWIADASLMRGSDKLTFDDFVEYSMFFFSQKQQEEGLKYIFQLFDTNNEGKIDKVQFDRACVQCGLTLKTEQINEVFRKASFDGKYIRFCEFVFFMTKTDNTGLS